MKKINVKKLFDNGITYLVLLTVSFAFCFPVLWLLLASFSKTGSIYSFDGFFPAEYSLDSFRRLFNDTVMYNYPKWFSNTLLIAVFSCLFGTILVIMTAYTMSRFNFRGRKMLMKITLILGMFPSFMAMTAVYILMTHFNLINQHWGLVLIYSAGAPLGYLVQKGFFDTIPGSIDEAARIDGASGFMIFWKIILPLSAPIIVYTSLTLFAWPWSDFILPRLLLKDRDLYTVAVGLMSLGDDEFSRFSAGAMFIAVPIIILYFGLSKFLISGLASGAVKE
ncbi:MAG: ABC transporter permease subunit [Lachnospiraceae bacterium]|nr:ABC transporter permease subunit [Lachnospiraceae bacterium]